MCICICVYIYIYIYTYVCKSCGCWKDRIRTYPYTGVCEKHSSVEENPGEDRLSQHQLRSWRSSLPTWLHEQGKDMFFSDTGLHLFIRRSRVIYCQGQPGLTGWDEKTPGQCLWLSREVCCGCPQVLLLVAWFHIFAQNKLPVLLPFHLTVVWNTQCERSRYYDKVGDLQHLPQTYEIVFWKFEQAVKWRIATWFLAYRMSGRGLEKRRHLGQNNINTWFSSYSKITQKPLNMVGSGSNNISLDLQKPCLYMY